MTEANDNGACAAASPDERLLRQIPGPLGALVAAGHGEAALILIKAFGGTNMKIPNKVVNSNLARLVGLDAAKVLVDAVGGNYDIRIPSATTLSERKAPQIMDAIEAGERTCVIARRLGVSNTYVSRIRKMMKPAPSARTSAAGGRK